MRRGCDKPGGPHPSPHSTRRGGRDEYGEPRKPHYLEVPVVTQGCLDPIIPHQDAACRIGQGEILIVVLR